MKGGSHSCTSVTLKSKLIFESRRAVHAFRLYCQLHRKLESQPDVSGCKALKSRRQTRIASFGWHLPWLEIPRQPLSLRDLLPRHLIFYYGHIVLCIIITLARREQPPLVSLDLILRHAFATVVADPDCIERRRNFARQLCETTSPTPHHPPSRLGRWRSRRPD